MSDAPNNKFTPLNSIGYSEIIRQIDAGAPSISGHTKTAGLSDDAGVCVHSEQTSISANRIFTEGVDFDLTYHAFSYVAYKVVSATISRLVAMNAKASQVQVSLSVPNRISYEMLQEFYQGIYSACREYQVTLNGGDINAGHHHLCIAVSAQGQLEPSLISYNSGAQQADALCVTGDLGSAYAGLHILMREKKHWKDQGGQDIIPGQLDLGDYEYVIKRQLVPKARYDLLDALREANIRPSAMTSVSRGLINDLKSLCDNSKVGAYLYQAAIPIAIETRQVADELKEDVDKYALYGGEDYEMLFTLPESEVEKFAKKFSDFAVIGRVTSAEEGINMQKDDGDVLQFADE